MLRQELQEDLHGHEKLTFLGSPAFVCMSYTFVSRGDSFCQSSTPECRKMNKNEARGGFGGVCAISGLFQLAGVPFEEMTDS